MELAFESRLEVTPDRTRPANVHDACLSVAGAQHLDDDTWINTGLRTQNQSLGHTDEIQRDLDLIAGFHGLAGPARATMDDVLAHHLKDRQHFFQ